MKIDNLKAVAKDFDIPVTEVIDFVTSYRGGEPTPNNKETHDLLSRRIEVAEEAGLSQDYINGLKDAYKLSAPRK